MSTRIREEMKCEVISLLGEVTVCFGDTQIHLPPSQARELAELLVQCADTIEDSQS